MRRRGRIGAGLAVALLAVGLLGACSDSDDGDEDAASTEEDAGGGDGAAADETTEDGGGPEAVVTIADRTFDPASVTLTGVVLVENPGKITWQNESDETHRIKFDGSAEVHPDIAPGDSYETFQDTEGTHTYFCEIHPEMKGTVVIEG